MLAVQCIHQKQHSLFAIHVQKNGVNVRQGAFFYMYGLAGVKFRIHLGEVIARVQLVDDGLVNLTRAAVE